jgi:transcriptional regulator with XRE-family HTH domain
MLNSTVDYNLIGNRIRKKRRELNLTQEQLANDLNLTTFYISKIENGKATATLETLSLIAHHLQLDLSYLISGTSTLEKKYYIDELNDICSKATKKQLDLIIRLSKAVLDD